MRERVPERTSGQLQDGRNAANGNLTALPDGTSHVRYNVRFEGKLIRQDNKCVMTDRIGRSSTLQSTPESRPRANVSGQRELRIQRGRDVAV
jgi:hypothetical protein